MIDPERELFKWGPIDGKILYIDSFMEQMVMYKKKIKETWPDVIIYIKDGKVLGISDYGLLRKYGMILYGKFIKDDKKCKTIFDKWNDYAIQIEKWCMKHRDSDLTKLSDNEIYSQLIEFFKQYDDMWVYGFIPEIANWGQEENLKVIIKKQFKQNFIEIFEALTAPEELSFFQIEERDLLKGDIEDHAKKYFWIGNSYGGVKFLTADDFRNNLKALDKKKLEDIQKFTENTKKRKQEVKKKYNIPDEIMFLASKLSYTVWWQDLRKKYIFIALHVINHFAKEIGRRNNITEEEIEMYSPIELLKLAEKGEKIDLNKRKDSYMSYYHEDKNCLTYYFGSEADEIAMKYTKINVDMDIKEIKGMVTSKGKAKGRVRILLGAKDFSTMEKGEILVASMTSPDYIVAMRKAAAIVTDEGGMTCHAAIVSRELGIPCIVATRIATKVLENGEIVEVDADNGIVRRAK
ncbi:MAG: PEP-utilizing enzyme [Candidatus Woesearchaeota archaeon]